LGDQEAIKWVAVVKGQCGDDGRMCDSDGQHGKVILRNLSLHEVLEVLCELVLADADLDSDLPIAGGAEQEFVIRGLHCGSSNGRELGVVQRKPEEGMRVQQHLHGMYSWKSFRCSSSSAMIVSLPMALPGRRGWRGFADSATSRATGRCCCVMITS